jgi:Zn-dependent M28 family amino/carboxypeptidase
MSLMKSGLLVFLVASSLLADNFNFGASVDEVVSSIDMEKWYQDTEHLALMNRYYRSEDIDRARDWLVEQFSALGLQTSLEEISINGTRGYNVVAEIRGSQSPEKIYIIGAHYDSTSENPLHAAPGAEDNASGTAALLTIAKAFAAQKPKSTIRFVAFSGEEAGLKGSKQHVQNIISRHEREKIRGVIIMDMIGYSSDSDLDALIETSAKNQYLVDLLHASARKYSAGRDETSFNYWGSDHVPFIDNDFLAALVIENDYEEYPDYHKSTDLMANLNVAMAKSIINMISGSLGYWVL